MWFSKPASLNILWSRNWNCSMENIELLWQRRRFEQSIETDRHRTCYEMDGQLQAVRRQYINRRVNRRLTAVECRVARNQVGESNRKSPTKNVELLWNGKRFELSIETDRHWTCCEINRQLLAVSIPTDGWIAAMEHSGEYSREEPSRGVQQGIADCWNIEPVAGNWLFHRRSI